MQLRGPGFASTNRSAARRFYFTVDLSEPRAQRHVLIYRRVFMRNAEGVVPYVSGIFYASNNRGRRASIVSIVFYAMFIKPRTGIIFDIFPMLIIILLIANNMVII